MSWAPVRQTVYVQETNQAERCVQGTSQVDGEYPGDQSGRCSTCMEPIKLTEYVLGFSQADGVCLEHASG